MTTRTIDLSGDPKRRARERTVRSLFLAAAVVSVAVSGAIVFSLVGKAWSFFWQVDKGALWSLGWFPRRELYDLVAPLLGSVVTTAIAMVVAVPLGLGAAIYLAEYAHPRARRWLKPSLEVLAGIPSVVLGYFALTWISPNIAQGLFGSPFPFNMLAAGIGVGILVTPLIASVSEDALRAVPSALREASYGLGAKKATTVRRVVLPAAVSGIMASMILGVSRAIGETMVVFMAGGNVGIRNFNPLQSGTTMTASIANLATGSDQVAGAGLAFESLFMLGFLLFIMTLVLNLISDRFVRRIREKY